MVIIKPPPRVVAANSMSVKKIKEWNPNEFLDDLKSVRDVMVRTESTHAFFRITKKDLKRMAETCKIYYYITDKIFLSKRNAMVVI